MKISEKELSSSSWSQMKLKYWNLKLLLLRLPLCPQIPALCSTDQQTGGLIDADKQLIKEI